jgi:N-acetylmuramic acid 6-phosphate etherase
MEMNRPQTETTLADHLGIDTWGDDRILAALVAGQENAIAAVRAASPQIAVAATAIAERISKGGKLYYAGAGTSIRIAVQDGSELPATFGMPEDKIGYFIAGGRDAMFDTLAEAEDDVSAGAEAADVCKPGDVLVAVAASGSTPYTLAAAERARKNGALVVSVVNNANSALGALADIEIVLNSGPEVIAGSTRLGAGTAQKAALNLLSTLTHMKLGAVYDGMMVNVQAGNSKLKARAVRIVMQISGAGEDRAAAMLNAAHGHIKPAVIMCMTGKSYDAAQQLLDDAGQNLRLALSRLAAP